KRQLRDADANAVFQLTLGVGIVDDGGGVIRVTAAGTATVLGRVKLAGVATALEVDEALPASPPSVVYRITITLAAETLIASTMLAETTMAGTLAGETNLSSTLAEARIVTAASETLALATLAEET
ncbi:MAG: hypothetical protein H0V29_03935, partial [Thermoleophilaceae bacterium]|nr:hypothetical protein [Thermoleophilaceae bacterium]